MRNRVPCNDSVLFERAQDDSDEEDYMGEEEEEDDDEDNEDDEQEEEEGTSLRNLSLHFIVRLLLEKLAHN